MWNRIGKFVLLVGGIIALGFLVHYSYQMYLFATEGPFSTRVCDVSRRVSSPVWYRTPTYSQRNKEPFRTALLIREYAFDLNFVLYIVEDDEYIPPCEEGNALWFSHDYNPETDQNFHEDLEWSKDATVIAVIIDGEYVFAYDFTFNKKYEEVGEIKELLESRSKKPLMKSY